MGEEVFRSHKINKDIKITPINAKLNIPSVKPYIILPKPIMESKLPK